MITLVLPSKSLKNTFNYLILEITLEIAYIYLVSTIDLLNPKKSIVGLELNG